MATKKTTTKPVVKETPIKETPTVEVPEVKEEVKIVHNIKKLCTELNKLIDPPMDIINTPEEDLVFELDDTIESLEKNDKVSKELRSYMIDKNIGPKELREIPKPKAETVKKEKGMSRSDSVCLALRELGIDSAESAKERKKEIVAKADEIFGAVKSDTMSYVTCLTTIFSHFKVINI